MIVAFGKTFKYIHEESIAELKTLEQEGAIYQYTFLKKDEEPTFIRIVLNPTEIVRYVEALWAFEQFRLALVNGSNDRDALETVPDENLVLRVKTYNAWARTNSTDTEYCLAAFLGPDLEELLCFAVIGRYEILGGKYNGDRRHLLKEIINALPACVAYLGRSGRSGLHDKLFTKEEEIRDLLYVMLQGIFSDLIYEDPTQKQAGSAKRIDLVIPEIKTLIELKFVRKINARDIVNQIKIDIESYHVHSSAQTLLFVVWDPERLLRDKSNTINDLSGRRENSGHEYFVEILVIP